MSLKKFEQFVNENKSEKEIKKPKPSDIKKYSEIPDDDYVSVDGLPDHSEKTKKKYGWYKYKKNYWRPHRKPTVKELSDDKFVNENESNELTNSDVYDYMIQQCGIECIREVASDEFGHDYNNYDESELYNELWKQGYLDQFIKRFGSAYYNLYNSDYYGIANTMIDDLEEKTGKIYNWD
jgi:hypothetical protein